MHGSYKEPSQVCDLEFIRLWRVQCEPSIRCRFPLNFKFRPPGAPFQQNVLDDDRRSLLMSGKPFGDRGIASKLPEFLDYQIIDISGFDRNEEEEPKRPVPEVEVVEPPSPGPAAVVIPSPRSRAIDLVSSDSEDDVVITQVNMQRPLRPPILQNLAGLSNFGTLFRERPPRQPVAEMEPDEDQFVAINRANRHNRLARLHRAAPVDLTRVAAPAIAHNERQARVWPNRRSLSNYLSDLFFPRPRVALPPALPEPEPIEPSRAFKFSELKCGICLEEIKNPSSTICGHMFCHDCIKVAQHASKQCPVCRTKLSSKQYHRLFV